MTNQPISTNVSPSPKKSQPIFTHFDFPAAMQQVKDGKKVTRLEWDDPMILVFLNEHLQITLPKNKYAPCDLIVSDGDIFGDDWYVVD
jgi:hypothetical protein